MNKSVKMVTLAAMLASVSASYAQTDIKAAKPTSGYVQDARDNVVVDPFGLCWRTGYFTPAMAIAQCDPDLVPRAAPAPAPAPRAAAPAPRPAPAPAPAPRPAPPPPAAAPAPARPAPAPARAPAPAPVSQKVTFAADAFFDFDKAVLKPEAKTKLDDLVSKLKGVNLEVIIAVGHTDSIGSDAYNQRLSVRRAAAVKAYLVTKGIEANRVYTEGKGEKQPVAPNRVNGKDSPDNRAKNRRVEIEVVGTRPAGR